LQLRLTNRSCLLYLIWPRWIPTWCSYFLLSTVFMCSFAHLHIYYVLKYCLAFPCLGVCYAPRSPVYSDCPTVLCSNTGLVHILEGLSHICRYYICSGNVWSGLVWLEYPYAKLLSFHAMRCHFQLQQLLTSAKSLITFAGASHGCLY
jgi:hypothetical protein